LYNIFDKNPTDRFNIFESLIKFASVTHNSDAVLSQIKDKDIELRIEEWGIDSKQKRELYKGIRNLFNEQAKILQAFKWTLKYLGTFERSEDDHSTEATEEAAKASLEAIKLPDLFQFDGLLNISAIKKLENHPTHKVMLQLLKIFIGETLEAFKTFADQNTDFLKSVGLSVEDCTRKMRLLSLATLGAANQEIPYSLISKTLQVNESEVELWVVMAISENLIVAKMDQLKRVVIVTQSLQRVFTRAQWKQLGDSLATWKNNVKALIETIRQSQQTQQHQLEQGIGMLPKAVQI